MFILFNYIIYTSLLIDFIIWVKWWHLGIGLVATCLIIEILKKKLSVKKIYNLFNESVDRLEIKLLNTDKKNRTVYKELKKKISENIAKKGLEQLPIDQLQFSSNKHLVKIKGASTYNSNEEINKAREYGILVHYILSQIKTLEDIDSVVLILF